jgi:hypothetical protein
MLKRPRVDRRRVAVAGEHERQQPVDVSDALKACEAAARYSRECVDYPYHADLTATRAGDADTACGADDVPVSERHCESRRTSLAPSTASHSCVAARSQTVDLRAQRGRRALEACRRPLRSHGQRRRAERWDAAAPHERRVS